MKQLRAADRAAETIENSFNAVEGSPADDKLKDGLKELPEKVAALTADLSDDDAREVARRVKKISEEATAEQPDKSLLLQHADKIKTVASKVADLAKPVATAVAAVLAFFQPCLTQRPAGDAEVPRRPSTMSPPAPRRPSRSASGVHCVSSYQIGCQA